jgi:hypothetical protein
MLTNMLTGMINARATIALATRLLEVVAHLPIILIGRQTAAGSLEELTLGMANALPEKAAVFNTFLFLPRR